MAMRSLRGAGSRPNMAEAEKDLGYAEFVNALVHLGWDQVSTLKRAKARQGGAWEVRTTAGLALWNLVEDEVRPRAGRFDVAGPCGELCRSHLQRASLQERWVTMAHSERPSSGIVTPRQVGWTFGASTTSQGLTGFSLTETSPW
mmetsp:Transcript_129452/g.326893  ORF Transcript_129452/g.326893 Transcript_129452/m.326893 type:complete len:145 (+) Transcript_129452:2-436(+)